MTLKRVVGFVVEGWRWLEFTYCRLRITHIGQHLLEEERELVDVRVAIGHFTEMSCTCPHYVGFEFEPLQPDTLCVCARTRIDEILLMIHLEVPIAVLRELVRRSFFFFILLRLSRSGAGSACASASFIYHDQRRRSGAGRFAPDPDGLCRPSAASVFL